MLVAATPSAQSRSDRSRDRDRIRVRERVVERTSIRNVTEIIGQSFNEDPCRDTGWDDDYYRSCDVREETMAAGPLTVDAGRNGGIQVEGWDRNEIRVRAVVTANARSEADAKQLASAVQIQAGSGKVTATGPTTERAAVVVGQLPHQRAAPQRSRSQCQQRRRQHHRRVRHHPLRYHQRRRALDRSRPATFAARHATAASR